MTDPHDAQSAGKDGPPEPGAPGKPPPVDAPAAEAEPQSGPADASLRIAALEAELAAERDRMLRARADAENTRKRSDRERAEALRYGASDLARDMLDIVDNLERALASMPADGAEKAEDVATLREGVTLTLQELNAKFVRHAIERIRPDPGDPFDPNRHQAVTQVPRPGLPGGVVAEVLQAGYRHHDRLLRAAVVATTPKDVGAAPAEEGAPGGEPPVPPADASASEAGGPAAGGARTGKPRAGP